MDHITFRLGCWFLVILYSTITLIGSIPEIEDMLLHFSGADPWIEFVYRLVGVEGSYRMHSALSLFLLLISLIYNQALIHSGVGKTLTAIAFLGLNLAALVSDVSEFMLTMLFYFHTFLASSFFFLSLMICAEVFYQFGTKAEESLYAETKRPGLNILALNITLLVGIALMYAFSFNIAFTFLYFIRWRDCWTTGVYVIIEVLLLAVFNAASVAAVPAGQRVRIVARCSALTMCSSTLMYVCLSDPMNEYCNLFGTALSGSDMVSPISFRSLFLYLFLLIVGSVACLGVENPLESLNFILFDRVYRSTDLGSTRWFLLCAAGGSSVALVVNSFGYEPRIIYIDDDYWFITLEPYNSTRFVVSCILPYLGPLLGTMFVIIGILHRRMCGQYGDSQSGTEQRLKNRGNIVKESDEFSAHFTLSLDEAVKNLRTMDDPMRTSASQEKLVGTAFYPLVNCYTVQELNIHFWNLPRYYSQSYFRGRNGSNACTLISVEIGRIFSQAVLAPPPWGYLTDSILSAILNAIERGNSLYDEFFNDIPPNSGAPIELSVEDVFDHFRKDLRIKKLRPSTPVAVDSTPEMASLRYQLAKLTSQSRKQVSIFTYNQRTSVFLVYRTGDILYIDTHTHGVSGALVVFAVSRFASNIAVFINRLYSVERIKMASLTRVTYLDEN